MSDEYPDDLIIDRFWRRVASLTTRYHDIDHKWIGGDEIRLWNSQHRRACNKCLNSKNKQCIIDEDQPSCRTCRDTKVGCDRKPQFVYDMTKDEFFASYQQFLAVFQRKEPGRLRRYDRPTPNLKLDSEAPQWRNSSPDSFQPNAKVKPRKRSTQPGVRRVTEKKPNIWPHTTSTLIQEVEWALKAMKEIPSVDVQHD
ncbi:hypothetical protein B0H16DRAFT_1696175, partial [Mycena metata]